MIYYADVDHFPKVGDLRSQMNSQQKIRVVADYGNLCGEGPLWEPTEQALYWMDITGEQFFRYHWKSRTHERIHEGFQITGFCLQKGGGFVVTNRKGIWLWSPEKDPVLLASEADGQECRPAPQRFQRLATPSPTDPLRLSGPSGI